MEKEKIKKEKIEGKMEKENKGKVSQENRRLSGEEKVSKSDVKCNDRDCPVHGKLKTRGRIFSGLVIKKFPRRITIEFERTTYIRKYERYAKRKTKIHARLPDCMKNKINVGDYIQIQECRPLSKIIHFVVLGEAKEEKKQ